LGLLILAGCYSRVRPEVDGLVCASANRPVDYLPDENPGKHTPLTPGKFIPAPEVKRTLTPAPLVPFDVPGLLPEKLSNTVFDNLLLTSAQQPGPSGAQPKKMT